MDTSPGDGAGDLLPSAVVIILLMLFIVTVTSTEQKNKNCSYKKT